MNDSNDLNAKHDDDDDELNCPICLMEIVSSNDARLDSCKHQFHIDCIKQWSYLKASCPLCKQAFTRISFDGQIFIVKKKGKRKREIHNELFGEDDEGENDDDNDDDDDDNDDNDDDSDDDDVLGYCIICLGECEPIDGQFLACRSRSCTSVVHQFCIDRFNDNSSWLCAECSRRRYQHSSDRYNVRESISSIISNGSSSSSSSSSRSRRSARSSFSGNRNSSSTHSILHVISDADAVAMRHSTIRPPPRSTTANLDDELSTKQQLLPYSNGRNSRELIENQIAIARQLNNASSSIKKDDDDKSKTMSEGDIIKASKAIIKNEKQHSQQPSSSSRRKTSASSSTSSLLNEVLGQSQSMVYLKKSPVPVPDNKSDQAAAALVYKSSGYTAIVNNPSSKAGHKSTPLSVSSSISKLIIPTESTTSAGAAALFLSRLRTANNELRGGRFVDMTGLFHEIKSFALSSDLDLIGKLIDEGLLDDLSVLLYPFNDKFIDYRDREMILRTINSLPVKKCHTSSEKKITKALSFCVSINEAYDKCSHGNVSAVATRIVKSWLKCFFKHDKSA